MTTELPEETSRVYDDLEKPYPGLRAFEEEEAILFFGRREHHTEMLSRLEERQFVAVVGASGSGKSSLVRAGLLPALKGGELKGAGARWRAAILRPGDGPFAALAAELAQPEEGLGLPADTLEQTLRESSLGLVEVLRRNPNALPRRNNLLILVDQFEEIFDYRRRGQVEANEARDFVALLLASLTQREFPIYVVLTIRSEFLGDTLVFPGLPESLNDSQYLTPRLKREQMLEAIVKPACVFECEVEPQLVPILLDDACAQGGTEQEQADRLPLLQHALMRLWQERGGGDTLSRAHFEELGGTLAKVLNNHAEQVFGELDDGAQKTVAERMFRCLAKTMGDRTTRSPRKLGVIRAVVHATCSGHGAATLDDALAVVVDRYRRPDCSFVLALGGGERLPMDRTPADDALIDISHEAFFRNWARFGGWLADEASNRLLWEQFEADAVLYGQSSPPSEDASRELQMNRADLWGGNKLEAVQHLKNRGLLAPPPKPVSRQTIHAADDPVLLAPWASDLTASSDRAARQEKRRRYNAAMVFLTESVNARETRRAQQQQDTDRRRDEQSALQKVQAEGAANLRYLTKTRRLNRFATLAAVVGFVLFGIAGFQWRRADAAAVEATDQREIADTQKNNAEKNRSAAEEARARAIEQSGRANMEKLRAEQSAAAALEARKKAEKAGRLAEVLRIRANRSLQEVRKQNAEILVKNAKIAKLAAKLTLQNKTVMGQKEDVEKQKRKLEESKYDLLAAQAELNGVEAANFAKNTSGILESLNKGIRACEVTLNEMSDEGKRRN